MKKEGENMVEQVIDKKIEAAKWLAQAKYLVAWEYLSKSYREKLLADIDSFAAILSPEPAKAPEEVIQRMIYASENALPSSKFSHLSREDRMTAAFNVCQAHFCAPSGIAQLLAERPDNLHEYQGCANDPAMLRDRTAVLEAELATLRAQQPKPRYTPVEVCAHCAERADKIVRLEESIAEKDKLHEQEIERLGRERDADWIEGLNGEQYVFLLKSVRERIEGEMVNKTGMTIFLSDVFLKDVLDVFMLMLRSYKNHVQRRAEGSTK